MPDIYDPSATSLICTKCGLRKPVSLFYRMAKSRTGHHSWCKDCADKSRRAYFKRNKEKELQRIAEWAKDNPERRKRIGRNWARTHSAEVNGRIRSKYRSIPCYRANMVHQNCKKRAAKKGIPYTLSPEWIDQQFAKGVCVVTGLPFDFSQVRGPLTPSLDRIDPEKGYTPENVQVVVMIYNAAKRNWYHEDVMQMAAALMSRAQGGADA